MAKGNILTITTIGSTNQAFLVDINQRLGEYEHFAAAADMTKSNAAKFYRDVFDLPMHRALHSILRISTFRNLLIDKIIEYHIDIIHVHTPVAAFMVRYALKDRYVRKRLGVKIVYTAHGLHFFPGNSPVKNLIYGTLEFVAGKWTDRLVVINKTDEHSARKFRLVAPDNLVFMPGIGVNLEKYAGIQLMPETQDPPYFLVVAEFIPRKRHRDILMALAMTPPEFHLYLAGVGVLQEEMRQLTVDLGIAERVHFLGHRSDVPELMRGSLATILVSSQEGLPRSVLEAMALGTLVIGSKIRGTADLLEGGSGVLVDVGDVESLAKEMSSIHRVPERYEAMKRVASSKIQQYGLERIVEMHRDLYRQLMAEQVAGGKGQS